MNISDKVTTQASDFFQKSLAHTDPEIMALIEQEHERQSLEIELIASENLVSRAVMQAQGSVMTNKYAEGYPGRRYYAGCTHVDGVERLAIERACALFQCAHANVQPHSGSQANQAVFMALLKPGDAVLGMALDAGGHLTHGARVNQSGKWFDSYFYSVDAKTYTIDYDAIEETAQQHKPKLIIAGGSAIPRAIDFARMRQIADAVGAWLLADIAHFSGLVAAGEYPSPIPHAHVCTSTTHKVLRGARGGLILTNDAAIIKRINSSVFPGMQGGPLMHAIVGKAVAFGEALQPDFKSYIKRVIANAQALSARLVENGFDILTGGTDTHLLLVDLRSKQLTGVVLEQSLERAGIVCNKNAVPFDSQKPTITSGVRLGTSASTTRGFNTQEFFAIADWISEIADGLLKNGAEGNSAVEADIRAKVSALCRAYPIYTQGLS